MKLPLLTLKFSGNLSKLEAPFLSDYYRVSLPHIRISLILGAIFYSAFGILDALLMPEQKSTIWFIRFVIVCPVLFGTLLASFSKSFERYMQPLLAGVFILAGGGIICMIVIAPPPVNYSYYAGLLLVFIWGYTFSRVRFLWASLAGWVQVVLYEIAAIWISPTPFAVLLSNSFFLISTNVIGMLACYSIEFYARRDFFLRQQLEIEREITERKQAEEALRESEERYRGVFAGTPDGIIIHDADGLILDANEAMAQRLEIPREAILGRHLAEVITPDNAANMGKNARSTLAGQSHIFETTYVSASGKMIPAEVHERRIQWRKGQAVLSISRDITERKQAEEALRESEEKYRLIFENSPLGLLYFDEKGVIVACNDNFVQIIGSSQKALIGLNMLNLPDKNMVSTVQKALNGSTGLYEGAYSSVTAKKTTPVRALFAPMISQGGHILGGAGIIEDITERKQAEEALQQSEERFRSMIQSLSDIIFILDGNGQLTYESPSATRILGYQPGYFIGKSPFTHIHPDDLDQVVKALDEVFRSVNPGIPTEFRARKADGTWICLEALGNNQFENPGIQGLVLTVRDISERKRTEHALQKSEERYRSLVENANEAIYVAQDGMIKFVNRAGVEITGYSEQEIISKPFIEFIHPDDRAIVGERYLKRLRGDGLESRYTFRLIAKNGDIKWLELGGALIDFEGKPATLNVVTDITERKRAEEELQESEERFRSVVEKSLIGIAIVDDAFRYIYVNDEFCNLADYLEQDILGKNFTFLLAEESKAMAAERYQRRQRGEDVPSQYEFLFVQKTGEKRIGEVRSAVYLDSLGKVKSVIQVIDITDRKRAEEERRILQERLQHADKMEAIGTLAGGIAHDFNHLLMGIQGYASLSLLDLDPSHPHYERLRRIEEQVQSGADLTSQLLGFARGGRYEVNPADMNEVIEKTSSMFGRTKKEISIHRKQGKDLWSVEVDRGQMEQVFLNLYINAWQAMPGGGEIYLEAQNVLLNDEQALSYSVKPGKYVKIMVTDTGTGMDEKTRERIFDPFFTTKEMGRGTGLGMATVYGIIKGHRGMIHVYSEPGQGTTFTIHLPASDKEVVTEKAATGKIVSGTETILVVDDEKMVLEVNRELLEFMGYRVYTVGSGQEAISVYMEKRNEIDLVILDMIMPGISGAETFDRLREINPGIKVLLSSGYSLTGKAQTIMDRGCNGFLQKPFTQEQLSSKVRELLD